MTANEDDYVSYQGPVLFDAGVAKVEFPIGIKVDDEEESEEMFQFKISSSSSRVKRVSDGAKVIIQVIFSFFFLFSQQLL